MDRSDRHFRDVASILIVAGTMTDVLPAAAAAVSLVWGLIRIYETATVQAIIARLRGRAPK